MLKLPFKYQQEIYNCIYLANTKSENKYFLGHAVLKDLKDGNLLDKTHSRVSISKEDGDLIGFMTACKDEDERFIHGLSVISFKKHNKEFLTDLYGFIWSLFTYHNFYKVRWKVICGSPHERTYDKLCSLYGGRIVGKFTSEVRLEDGQLCDVKYYEIMREHLSERATKVKTLIERRGFKCL